MKNLTLTICLTVAVLLGGVGTSRGGDSNYGDLTVTQIVRVYDGDTFYVHIDGRHSVVSTTYDACDARNES